MRLSICLLAAFMLCACSGRPEQALEEARALTFQRQPEAALRRYEEALLLLAKKSGPREAAMTLRALKGAGDICYLDLRLARQAMDYYQSLLRLFPSAPEAVEARLSLAEMYRASGDHQSEVLQLSTLVQDFPDHENVDRHRAESIRAYFTQGNHHQAVVEARLLLQRHPESSHAIEAQMFLAASLGMLGQREAAIDSYAALIRRWPEAPLATQARVEASQLLAELERDDEASALLVEAMRTHAHPQRLQQELQRLRKRIDARRTESRTAAQAFGR